MIEGSPEAKFQESFGGDLVQKAKVHLNLDQDVIIVTEDKLRLCLRDFQDALAAKERWVTPFSLGVAVLLVFLTSAFHDFILKANVWQAVFAIIGILCGFWFLRSVYHAFKNRRSLQDLIIEIKREAAERAAANNN